MKVCFVLVLVACAASITYAENLLQTSVSEGGSNDNKGKKIDEVKQTETSGKSNKHDEEFSKKGQDTKELHKSSHQEKKGKKSSHHAEDSHKSSKHSAGDAKSGLIYASGKKHKKGNYLKGFREKFHKDEEKKHDSFFSNGEKSGEFEVYGKKKSKYATDSFNKNQKKSRKTIVVTKNLKVANPTEIYRQQFQKRRNNLVTNNRGRVLRYGRRRRVGQGKNRNVKKEPNNKNNNQIDSNNRTQITSNFNENVIDNTNTNNKSNNTRISITTNENCTEIETLMINDTDININDTNDNANGTDININDTNDNANGTTRRKRDTNEVEQSTNSHLNQVVKNDTNINYTTPEEDPAIIRIKLRPNSLFNVTYKEDNQTIGNQNLKQSSVIHLKPLPSTLNFTVLNNVIKSYEKKKKKKALLEESNRTTPTKLRFNNVTENVTQMNHEINNKSKDVTATARAPLTLEEIGNTSSSLVHKHTKNKVEKTPSVERKSVQKHGNLKTTEITESKMNEYINLLQKVKTDAGPSNSSMQINFRNTNITTSKPKGLKKNRRKPKSVSKHS